MIGRSIPELHALVEARLKDAPAAQAVAHYAIAVLPDLHLFYVSGAMVGGKVVSVHAGPYVDWAYVASATGYGLGYSACVLALAMLVFSRRDFV